MKKLRLTETELIAIINTIINEEEGTEGGGVDSGTSDMGVLKENLDNRTH